MIELFCSNCNKTIIRRFRKRDLECKNHFCCKKCESEFRKGKLTRPHKKNNIILKDDYAIIEINNNIYGKCECLIDLEDVEKVKDHFWNIRKDKRHLKCTPYVESFSKNDGRIHLHRLIMNCSNELVIDHINGNNLDNRKQNLKICTQQKNTLNNHFAKNISYINRDKKYVVYFQINGKQKKICYTRDYKEAEYYASLGRDLILNNKIEELLNMPCKKINTQRNNTSGYNGVN